MSESMELKLIQRSSSEIEVDPSVCFYLNDENTVEENIIIPSYEQIKDTLTFNILSQTNLAHVPRFILRKFSNLHQLRMINTGITTLNSESFQTGSHLKLIDLRNNHISGIPANVFAELNQLEEINLANNKITQIEPNAFNKVSSLKILILSNNMLQTIAAQNFIGAENLRELYLESNNIRNIETNAFNLKNLEIISLSDNRLTSISHSIFENAIKLEKIDLSKNDLVELGHSLKNCLNVYSLNLNDNSGLKDVNIFQLTKILPNLSYLHLANTGVKLNQQKLSNRLEDDESDNLSLTHLDLSGNNLSSPDIFLQLTHYKSLKTVILNENAFTHLNQVSEFKRLFPRLNAIQLKNCPNLKSEWIEQSQLIFKNLKIKLSVNQN